jgi:V/A-type H+-transporting ATPase subunit E
VAYENLLKSVEESAQDRERELREKSQRLAEEIRADAKRESEAIQERSIREAEHSAAVERNKQLYLAKGAIKENALRSREKIFHAAFGDAARQLSRIRQDKQYPAIFERLAREAAGVMGTAKFRIHIDRRDLDLCTTTLARLGIQCEVLPDIESDGGLVVSSPDGLVVISNTVESRLERIKEHKRLEIYALLFGG